MTWAGTLRWGRALTLPVAALVIGCEGDELVVAERRGAAGAPSVEGACLGPLDCELNEFCAAGCGAVPGVCELRPIACPAEPESVCGCDGVTYWNDCLRRQSGARLAGPGECVKGGARCGRPMDPSCPPGAVCARVLPPQVACTDEAPGICWVVPPMCPKDEPGTKVFLPCTPMPGPGPGPGMMCMNACEAIRSGAVVRRSPGPGPCMP